MRLLHHRDALTHDLFAAPSRFEPLPIPDADVQLWREFPLPQAPATLLDALIAETPWRSETITLWGRDYVQPRLVAWHSDPGRTYTYSGTTMAPLPWTPLLSSLRARVEHACAASFNSVLLNFYRDGADGMGMHSDDEPELGPQPVIASLSLGETRVLAFRHRDRRDVPTVRVPLASGDLLLMRGDTQHRWKHGIAKSRRPLGPRVNLTFRTIR